MNNHPDRLDRPIESYDPAEPLVVPYGDVLAARNAAANLTNILEDTRDPLPIWRQEQVMRTLAASVAADADEVGAGTFATIDQAAAWTRDLRKRLGSYLPWPGPGGTQHPPPPTARPTAMIQDRDGRPLDRDEYAAMLTEQVDPTEPTEGDRVRLTYGDGSTIEGTWTYIEVDDSWAVLTDAGKTHTHVTGQVRRDVVRRAERPRLPLLNQREALVVAALLDELAGVYDGEPLGRLARATSVRIYDRLGI